ncbi:hypothetical protein DXG01_015531, partial [Tephrocybe rancida]
MPYLVGGTWKPTRPPGAVAKNLAHDILGAEFLDFLDPPLRFVPRDYDALYPRQRRRDYERMFYVDDSVHPECSPVNSVMKALEERSDTEVDSEGDGESEIVAEGKGEAKSGESEGDNSEVDDIEDGYETDIESVGKGGGGGEDSVAEDGHGVGVDGYETDIESVGKGGSEREGPVAGDGHE